MIKDAVVSYLKGMLMGIADLFPGISGGTVALILGIYPRFMKALSGFNHRLFTSLLKSRKEIMRRVSALDPAFIVPLVLGIGTSIFLGARITSGLIQSHPVILMAFFLGFLLASLHIPWRKINRRGTGVYFSFAVSAILAGWISLSTGAALPNTAFFIALSGLIAITFMLLPGVSGSSALLLLGTYGIVIDAVSSLDMTVLVWFILGAAGGVAIVSRGVTYMLDKRPNVTFAALTGLLAGSLLRVWPIRTADAFAEGYPMFSLDFFSGGIVLAVLLGAGSIVGIEMLGRRLGGKV